MHNTQTSVILDEDEDCILFDTEKAGTMSLGSTIFHRDILDKARDCFLLTWEVYLGGVALTTLGAGIEMILEARFDVNTRGVVGNVSDTGEMRTVEEPPEGEDEDPR